MTSVIYSIEDQVLVLFILAETSKISVVLEVELTTSAPGQLVAQVFTSSPVADEVLITVIDQDLQSLFGHVGQIVSQVSHKVLGKVNVDGGVAFSPRAASDVEDFLDLSLHQESIDTTHIVAKRGITAGFSDIIDIELEGLASDSLDLELALDHSGLGLVEGNEGVTKTESIDQLLVQVFINEAVFIGESGVLGILVVNTDETVTNTDTLEVQVETSSSEDVGGDGGDVVSSVGFTGDVEISALVLREFNEEFLKEDIEISSDLSLVLIEFSGGGETSSQRLINVKDVGNIIP